MAKEADFAGADFAGADFSGADFSVARANALLREAGHQWLREISYFKQIDSTNRYLLAAPLPIHGAICVADKQTAGRGRMGRRWQGADGVNIALSIGWQPNVAVGAVGAALGLAVGVAVAKALGDFAVPAVGLKWPNDVFSGEQKIGGILVESVQGSGRENGRYVIGVGVNLQISAAEAEHIAQDWSDLQRLGVAVDRTALTARIINLIADYITIYAQHGMAALRDEWNALHVFNRRTVEFVAGEAAYVGEIIGIDAAGALVLLIDGARRTFIAGEIKRVRAADKIKGGGE